ncbi:LysR substrate-binding domain-containing protein [Agrobacterium sp. rho-8.1]|nr:LysR substrate-binding domain-containing protein [Agrobacterium sp. rho-8.1]
MTETPEDLRDHVCIRNIFPSGKPYAWQFSRLGKKVDFGPTGSPSLDDHQLMAGAALVGVGLAYGWEERARRYVTEGTLVECLAPWSAPEDWLYLYDPTRKYLWGGLRAVIDALRVW